MADSPGGGILGDLSQGTGVEAQCPLPHGAAEPKRAGESPDDAESPAGQPAGGGVGDSPVCPECDNLRGLTNGHLEGSGIGQAAAGLVASGPAQRQVGASLARDLAVVQKADNKIRRRAERIVAAALRAPELPEDGSAPAGWTKRDVRVARDAMSTLKTAPAYLGMAQRVHESYTKQDAGRPAAPTINADLIQINVMQVGEMPVRKLRDE